MNPVGIIASSKLKSPTAPVAGYFAWYDASDTATITLSGSDVTQWNDKSANAYHLSQATSTYRPNSGTRTLNSKNVIDYTSNTDTLVSTAASSVWKFLNYNTYTIFYAGIMDSYPAGDTSWWMTTRGGSAAAGPGIGLFFNDAGKLTHNVVGNSGTPVNNVATSAQSATTRAVWTVIGDPANATNTNRSDIRKDSGSAEKNNASTGTAQNANPFQTLRVGDYIEAGTLSIDGAIGEIIIYDSILTSTQIADNQTYLKNKWGI